MVELGTVHVTAGTASASVSAPIVHELNEYATVFYVGRGLTGVSPYSSIANNWVDRGSWALGACTYAIYKGTRALVYDSMMIPEFGQWVRTYLTREKGVTSFSLVLSHWHLDHIAGNVAYEDCPIIALGYTRATLERNRARIEAGTLWGPPAIRVVLPNATFSDKFAIYLEDIRIEFHHFNIHSHDGNVMYIPSAGLLFAGDTLEDPITFMVEPDEVSTHIAELERLKQIDIDRIFPNHGSFEVIRAGGYAPSFIDAAQEYATNMLRRVREPDFHEIRIEDVIPEALARNAVSIWEPYRAVHQLNLKLMREFHAG
jgi:glyoxylase-like metal-dependent hydrolase (beta-lactamase superfamily II)